ncbi:MAG: thioredoxin-dependent thiol peroxidase [Acidobacteria bacterium]|nr:thioredoxin-dependent thiol peroxidase [Acidobacteriota bacterium]
MLRPGDKAPSFSLRDTQGKTVKLQDLKGKKIALYFYPKDMTPGCTKEACNLRDNFSALKRHNITVLGVSSDDQISHQRFTEKFELPFPLLSDPEHEIAERYGVWGEKKLYGKTYMGIKRMTFMIDEEGRIERIIDKVVVEDHAAQILAGLG